MYLEINHGLYFQTPKTPAMLCIAITVLTRRINICKKCAIFDELYYVFEAEFLIYLLCHIFRLDFYLVDLVHFCTVIFPQPHMKSLASILSMVSATPPGVSDDPSRFFILYFASTSSYHNYHYQFFWIRKQTVVVITIKQLL